MPEWKKAILPTKKANKGKVSNIAAMDGTAEMQASALAAREGRKRIKCQFVGSLRCTSMHHLHRCSVFGDLTPKERHKIIQDINMCPPVS